MNKAVPLVWELAFPYVDIILQKGATRVLYYYRAYFLNASRPVSVVHIYIYGPLQHKLFCQSFMNLVGLLPNPKRWNYKKFESLL